MIKLLIVDDSALMRKHLSQVFLAEGDFEVRLARSGQEAVDENRSFRPDVVTLDINMPEMDGITALSIMMAERPVRVVMVSSLTEKGALATFEALNLGAVDYVAKPGGTISLSLDAVKSELISKIRAALRSKLRGAAPIAARSNATGQGLTQRIREERHAAAQSAEKLSDLSDTGLLLIGVSTGGPRALEELLPSLPAKFPLPVVIVQHMPACFTAQFASRLNSICPLNVVEVAGPTPISVGTIHIAKGGSDLLITRRAGALTVLPKPESREHLWHPSVELMGRSALQHVKPTQLIGVMLTGMGSDGCESFAEIKRRGGRTIAESEDSAVVFGMPAELIKHDGASLVLPLNKIAAQLNAWTVAKTRDTNGTH